ncbi:leucine-rich repeat flightless-interacting protein 2 isoform X1 [Coccinella septempunctata]|uniref:leucine-rich repeat flightless-interacting protein 2 isoform X1 n=2 Tax=Coccinella septempunctata TaxID=41139 RepID=UPI001D08C6CA|nr:leucine-rich repeat flightless-interacting protein 2 isoform X1 [Coccinella septempunctata]XP_044753219.1 leucine-rich repeat flightless-interacting protein 2 isoform X1 [Coccinella septempunctata]XP_044753220.1 leucine-rich repeat flightless-interacting protein 2 isoform X1 [Coccinella septempunctata]XP_044753221.1 leucine-rich repeat flightless-interacting protein 2 isoform X1 [Coccinella septempunctata]
MDFNSSDAEDVELAAAASGFSARSVSGSLNDDLDGLDDGSLSENDGFGDDDSDDDDIISQFMEVACGEAEERLRVKRQARAEAREIRMRELEKQQKEQEENADRQFDMLAEPVARTARTSISRYMSSRRSSEDSLEDGGSLRELRHELREVEDKFRKAMITNAQLDNEKAALTYQIELLKDKLQELEEEQSQLRREHKEKCREHDQMKRLCTKLKHDLEVTKAELDERDKLITEHGLVIVSEEAEETNGDISMNSLGTPKKSLVKVENAKLLENAGDGTLDVRLSRFIKEKRDLEDEINHLKLELEEEKSKKRKSHSVSSTNGPIADYDADGDAQRDGSSLLADYKFRAQKAEQDVATLQATVARLESQVVRYKAASEASEKLEETLKAEKRKLQREARDAINRAEELETSNLHLLKRLDKLKNAKSTLLKEL